MANVYICLKDPDGIYDSVIDNNTLTQEEKEYLLAKFFRGGDYIDLIYDTETKELKVRPRS